MRHLDVKLLWLQECVQRGLLHVGKVSGVTNVADALTKFHDIQKLRSLCKPHGVLSGPDDKSSLGRGGGVWSMPPELLL